MTQADLVKWDERYLAGAYGDRRHPSALLEQWIGRIPPGRALDVACGAGRNALYLAAHGFVVDAVDISGEALAIARANAQRTGVRVNWIEHDLDESLALAADYALILVVRYMNLPLIRELTARLAPGGYLVCEQHLVIAADVVGPSGSPFREMTEEDRKLFQAIVDEYYEGFLEVVARGRKGKLPATDLRTIADGRIYTAPQALKLGLIDAIGYFDDAFGKAKDLASLKSAKLVSYTYFPKSKSNIYATRLGDVSPLDAKVLESMQTVLKTGFYYLWLPQTP